MESFLTLAEELELNGLSGRSDEKVAEYPEKSFSRADLNNQQEESTISNVKCERNIFESIVMRIQPKLKQTPTIDSDTIEKIERMIEKRTSGYSLELITFEILASEPLRLIAIDNRLIIDFSQT